MEPIVSFSDFSFRYRTQVEPTLRNINLSIERGQKVLIAGQSGSGKSTLSRCINALIPDTYDGEAEGSVRVCSKNPMEDGIFEMSHHVGTVLQDTDGQFIGLTVGEDIAFSLENDCVPREEMHERTLKAARTVGMEGFLKSSPRALSGGQKQRVSMAGVLVDDVEVLLFDEPLANLDPAAGKSTIELIDSLQKESGKTVIIIEHRLEDVLHRPVDRIILMAEGRIAADMTPARLISSGLLPKHGIREPLYIAALRLAGCGIREEDSPESADGMNLGPYREKLCQWFARSPAGRHQAPGKELIVCEHVSYSYPAASDGDVPRKALDDVSLRVRQGEMVGIAGKNGAGKTTLSALLCGFMQPDEGRILLDGTDASTLSITERGERIGLVMQNPNQMISKPLIRDEVALGLVARDVPKAEADERVNAALETCGLYPFRNWPVSALSFGQKKRVTIASILVLDPLIMILDEPTAGQDARHYTEIMEFLRKLNEEKHITILMITHDMHLMLEYTDRAIVLADGKTAADDRSPRILTDGLLTEKASLKQTSLYTLANRAGISDAASFVERFIQCDREARRWPQ